MKKWLAVLAVFLAALMMLSGCGRIAEKAMEKAIEKGIEKDSGSKVDISKDDGSISVKGEDGSQTQIGGDVKWPENFPSDAPELKGVKLTAVSTDANGGGIVTFEEADEKDMQSYISDLLGAGFEESSTMNTDGGFMNSYKKGDYTVTLTFTKKDGTGLIGVGKNN